MFDLAKTVESAPDDGEVRIPAGEHIGNFILRRPVHLIGRGPSTHLLGAPGTGPTVEVLCAGVTLENLGIEHLDGVALRCAFAARPILRAVSIRNAPPLSNADIGSNATVAPRVTDGPVFQVTDVMRIARSQEPVPPSQSLPDASVGVASTESMGAKLSGRFQAGKELWILYVMALLE